jgi:acetyl-CoA C-acetyltransferase
MAYIVGAYEHPIRDAGDKTLAELQAESAAAALADAGLTKDDVDGFFCGPDTPGTGPLSMLDYLNLDVRYVDTTNTSGSSYTLLAAHAARAVDEGKCDVALITQAARMRADLRLQKGGVKGGLQRNDNVKQPDYQWEAPFGMQILNVYGMTAMRHAHLYGTTGEELAWIKVAASEHAKHNPNAFLPNAVTVEEVVNSPVVADPLRRLDCCVTTDGGGALVITREEIAKKLNRPLVRIKGTGEQPMHQQGGYFEITESGAVKSGKAAFAEAGVTPKDIKYASLYDSFTITVLMQLEDLGFCEKGQGGRFVMDGNLIAGHGSLPVNTDGGGLCNNHPGARGGLMKTIEAVRQIRGEALPEVQVPNCDLALVNAIGGQLGVRHASGTLILERAA